MTDWEKEASVLESGGEVVAAQTDVPPVKIEPDLQQPDIGIEEFKKTLTPEKIRYLESLQKKDTGMPGAMSVAALEPKQVIGEEKFGEAAEPGEPMSWRTVLSKAVVNTPKSAGQFVVDIIAPFLNPIETAKAIGNLSKGIVQKIIPGRQEQEALVDNMIDALNDRYGSIENFKKTLAKDPVGVVSDISSVLVPVGTAAKAIGVTAKAGKSAATIGAAIEPLGAGVKAIKGISRKIIPKDKPSGWYESAAKFSTTLDEKVRKRITNTALDENIMPTLKGMDNLREKINTINSEISKMIDASTKRGDKIPVNALFTHLKDLRKDVSYSTEARKLRGIINRVAREVSIENKKRGGLTPDRVQKIKQRAYKETDTLYSKATQKPIKGEIKQAIARSAKESLENIFPEIKQLNKRDGSLISLRNELDKSVKRIRNRDVLGIGVPIKGVAGGTVGGGLGMVAMVTLGLLDTPAIKAKLAIVANRLKKKGVILAENSALSRILSAAPGMGAVSARQAEKIRQIQETR